MKILITLNDQGGGVMEWNYKELAATLRASMSSSHPPVVVIEDDGNRYRPIQSMHHRGGIKDIEFGG